MQEDPLILTGCPCCLTFVCEKLAVKVGSKRLIIFSPRTTIKKPCTNQSGLIDVPAGCSSQSYLFLRDNHYKTVYEPVRIDKCSCRVLYNQELSVMQTITPRCTHVHTLYSRNFTDYPSLRTILVQLDQYGIFTHSFTRSLLEIDVKSTNQSQTRTLFAMLFHSYTPKQVLEQHCLFVNCDILF